MSFDWREYLTLAEQLALSPDEASRRSAISRAYYALYHRARPLLEAPGASLSERADSHAFVWRSLESRGRGLRRLGQQGRRLRDLRQQADYEPEARLTDTDVQQVLESVRQLMTLIDSEIRLRE